MTRPKSPLSLFIIYPHKQFNFFQLAPPPKPKALIPKEIERVANYQRSDRNNERRGTEQIEFVDRRHEINLPWKPHKPSLADDFDICQKCMNGLYQILSRDLYRK